MKPKFSSSSHFLTLTLVAAGFLAAVPALAAVTAGEVVTTTASSTSIQPIFVVASSTNNTPIITVMPNQRVLTPKAVKITKKTSTLDLSVEYPQFGQATIDKDIRDFIGVTIKNFGPGEKSEHWRDTLNISYKVSQYQNKTVSVRFYIYTFTGGAHGSQDPNFRTYNLKTGKRLSYNDIFKPDYEYLTTLWRNAEPQVIAAYKAEGLIMDKNEMDWIREGSGPKADNYRNFYLDNRGVIIYFGQYQAAPYAYGTLEVPVKYSKFGDGLSDAFKAL